MTLLIIIFMGAALLLYVLLGGADFGAGILEILTGKKSANAVSKAIAPVWEANHVWLIVVVVILFMGFPPVYHAVSVALHIPLLIMLIGIIIRGVSFTFRYYDISEERLYGVYSAFFKVSSVFTPFFLGVILGSVILGRITLDMTQGFYRVFLYPWLNLFSASMGVFTVILFSFLAAVYLAGELEDKNEAALFARLAKRLTVTLVAAGGLVFAAAEADGAHLLRQFIQSPASIVCMGLATAALPLLWRSLTRGLTVAMRVIAGAQTTFILAGWFAIQYPVLVNLADSPDLTVGNSQAPASSMTQLAIALAVGLALVIPALVYLFKVFKFGKPGREY